MQDRPVLPVAGDVRLCPGMLYVATVVVEGSNASLDCGGATVSAGSGTDRLGYGLIFLDGRSFSRVQVRRCRFEEFLERGIDLFSQATADDFPSDNVLDSVSVVRAGAVGIFVGPWAARTIVHRSTIELSGLGVYLERESHHALLSENVIHHNGYSSDARRHLREGLAVDASHHNTIVENRFETNALADVTLYKNCGEIHRESGVGIRRLSGASDNLIVRNDFRGSPVGIHIASRQGGSFRCSADWYAEDEDGTRRYRDYARNNAVVGNIFRDFGRHAVIVADSGARLIGNQIIATPDRVPFYVGSAFLDGPLRRPDLPEVEVRYVRTGRDYGDESLVIVERAAPAPVRGPAIQSTIISGNVSNTVRLLVSEHGAEVQPES